MTREEAEKNLKFLKAHKPFSKWFTVEINGEWYFRDSLKKIKADMKKNGVTEAEVLSL